MKTCFKRSMLNVFLMAALAMTGFTAYSQEVLVDQNTPDEAEKASLEADSHGNQLLLTVKGAEAKQLRGFGLSYERLIDVTASLHSSVAENKGRLQSGADGFTLDLGLSEGKVAGCTGNGILSLRLTSGEVVSAPVQTTRSAPSTESLVEECGSVEQDQIASDPRQLYTQLQQEAANDPEVSSVAPVMMFTTQDGRLLLTVVGATWNQIQQISWSHFDSQDYTKNLKDALTNGTARQVPIIDGFRVEFDQMDLKEAQNLVATMTLDNGAVLSAPIHGSTNTPTTD